MKDLNISVLFDFYGDCLTEKQRELFDFYYNEDFSLAEVAENVGISRQGVSESVKRTEQQLIEFEKKLHLYEITCELKRLAALCKNGQAEVNELFKYIDNI